MIAMVRDNDLETLIGSNMAKINGKIEGNEHLLSSKQILIYDADILKLGKNYVREELRILKTDAIG